jgi:hypothetical protein
VILALDPGPTQSALVLYDERVGLCQHFYALNDWVIAYLAAYHAQPGDTLVIEQIASYGMPVGGEIFQTCVWSGRFYQEWTRRKLKADWITRQAVKLTICGQARAKDGNVRAALIDRFGGPLTTKKGGPLYKMSGDRWAALAVAVAWLDPARPFDAAPAAEAR